MPCGSVTVTPTLTRLTETWIEGDGSGCWGAEEERFTTEDAERTEGELEKEDADSSSVTSRRERRRIGVVGLGRTIVSIVDEFERRDFGKRVRCG